MCTWSAPPACSVLYSSRMCCMLAAHSYADRHGLLMCSYEVCVGECCSCAHHLCTLCACTPRAYVLSRAPCARCSFSAVCWGFLRICAVHPHAVPVSYPLMCSSCACSACAYEVRSCAGISFFVSSYACSVLITVTSHRLYDSCHSMRIRVEVNLPFNTVLLFKSHKN